jgi:hypothetical protein
MLFDGGFRKVYDRKINLVRLLDSATAFRYVQMNAKGFQLKAARNVCHTLGSSTARSVVGREELGAEDSNADLGA